MNGNASIRKWVVVTIALAAAGLALGLFALWRRADFRHAPWDLERPLEFPRAALAAPNGDYIVTDRGDRRISRIAPDGRVLWSLDGESRNGGFYACTCIGIDASGTLWIDNIVYSPEGTTEREEFLPVYPDGKVGAPALVRTYEDDQRSDYTRQAYYMSLVGDAILFISDDEEGNAVLRSAPLDGSGERAVAVLEGYDAYADTSSAVAVSEREIWFLKPDGSLDVWRGGAVEPAFVPDPASGPTPVAPSSLLEAGDGGFMFLDNKYRILRWSSDGVLSVLFEPDVRLPGFYCSGLSDAGARMAVIDLSCDTLHVLDTVSGAMGPGLADFRATASAAALGWAVWAAAVLAVACLIAAAAVLYAGPLKRRTPLLAKQLLLLLPLVVAAVVALSAYLYAFMEAKLADEINAKLTAWASLGALRMSAADLETVHPETDGLAATIESEAFARLTTALDETVSGNDDPWNEGVYDYVYFVRDGQFYVFDQYAYFERYLPRTGMRETLETGEGRNARYVDVYSEWMSSFQPVVGEDGSVAGIFEVTVDYTLLSEVRREYRNRLAAGLGGTVAALAIVLTLFNYLLLRSIRSLKSGAARVAAGDYGVELAIRTRDEMEDLGSAFNSMTREVKHNVGQVVAMSAANAKFVPDQFLGELGRTSILDVRLGDQVEREMTILFSDIRNFTDVSERMTPEENFAYLNRYLERQGPKIREAGGFIDKYIGDSIMALFPRGPGDAVAAGLALLAGLADFPGLRIGVGIHTGRLMLGIIGEERRFDGTVISDAVNLASRIESLTKYYGVAMLSSGDTLGKAADRSGFATRLLDKVRVKGRGKPTELYEIIAPTDPAGRLKAATRDAFGIGLASYSRGELDKAAKVFEAIVARNPGDNPAKLFLKRCQVFAARELPEGWDGVTTFADK